MWCNEVKSKARCVNMTLETEIFILRQFDEEDAENVYLYAKHPDVGPIAGWPVHRSVEDSLEVIRTVLSAAGTVLAAQAVQLRLMLIRRQQLLCAISRGVRSVAVCILFLRRARKNGIRFRIMFILLLPIKIMWMCRFTGCNAIRLSLLSAYVTL